MELLEEEVQLEQEVVLSEEVLEGEEVEEGGEEELQKARPVPKPNRNRATRKHLHQS